MENPRIFSLPQGERLQPDWKTLIQRNSRSLNISDDAVAALIPQKLIEEVQRRDPTTKLRYVAVEREQNKLDISVRTADEPAALEVPSEVLNIGLMVDPNSPNELFISNISVDLHLLKRGIGSEFYTRLQQLAKVLGFRFITGSSSSESLTFFEKLGAHTKDKIDPYFFENLFANYYARQISSSQQDMTDYIFVDFLYKKDSNEYRKKNPIRRRS